MGTKIWRPSWTPLISGTRYKAQVNGLWLNNLDRIEVIAKTLLRVGGCIFNTVIEANDLLMAEQDILTPMAFVQLPELT